MVTFLFSVHTITEAKQYAGLGRAEPGLQPGRWILPGAPWCSAVTAQCLMLDILHEYIITSSVIFAVISYFWQEVYATIFVERNFHNAPSPKCGLGFAPDATGGVYSTPPDPITAFGQGSPFAAREGLCPAAFYGHIVVIILRTSLKSFANSVT